MSRIVRRSCSYRVLQTRSSVMWPGSPRRLWWHCGDWDESATPTEVHVRSRRGREALPLLA